MSDGWVEPGWVTPGWVISHTGTGGGILSAGVAVIPKARIAETCSEPSEELKTLAPVAVSASSLQGPENSLSSTVRPI